MGNMKKRIAVIGAVSALAVGGGVAWAAWDSDGSGTATASAGNTDGKLTVTAVSIDGDLVPGAKRAVKFTVKNDNDFPVKLKSLTLTDIVKKAGTGGATCTGGLAGTSGIQQPAASVDISGQNLTVAKNTTSAQVTVADAIEMTNASDNGCQNAQFDVSYKVGSESAAS